MPRLITLAATGLLAACGGGSTEPPPAPPQKTDFDPMTQQLDKVKQQAETLPDERKAALDKAIDGN